MPFKANADHRHHIPAQRHRVKIWAEYDAGLRARGSLTVWFTDEAIEAWHAAPRTTPGGQPCYSDLAITTTLTLLAPSSHASQPELLDRTLTQQLGAADVAPYGPEVAVPGVV